MYPLLAGQIISTEGTNKPMSRAIAHFTGSPLTHNILLTGHYTGVEAWFPRVRAVNVSRRLEELRKQDRAYVVMDLPELTPFQRRIIASRAQSYVGRFYDIGQVLLFALTGKFHNDGPGTLVCSRLVTAAYLSAGEDLFDDDTLALNYPPSYPRLDNLRNGYVTPVDLLYSRLEVREFHPSKRIRNPEQFRRQPGR